MTNAQHGKRWTTAQGLFSPGLSGAVTRVASPNRNRWRDANPLDPEWKKPEGVRGGVRGMKRGAGEKGVEEAVWCGV